MEREDMEDIFIGALFQEDVSREVQSKEEVSREVQSKAEVSREVQSKAEVSREVQSKADVSRECRTMSHLNSKDISSLLEFPSSEPDRPSEGDLMYDSDKDPDYKPFDCSESECEQFFADSDNDVHQSDSSEKSDDASENPAAQKPDDADDGGQVSNDPGEGTSNQPDTADNSHQATADSGERTGTQPKTNKKNRTELGKNKPVGNERPKIIWNKVKQTLNLENPCQ
ncbi:hypothetical protein J6590_093339 [Homalodisca vitripennis]|nr:hypothetical protein J6590_093339 [Homalodisca vitripennis]